MLGLTGWRWEGPTWISMVQTLWTFLRLQDQPTSRKTLPDEEKRSRCDGVTIHFFFLLFPFSYCYLLIPQLCSLTGLTFTLPLCIPFFPIIPVSSPSFAEAHSFHHLPSSSIPMTPFHPIGSLPHAQTLLPSLSIH